MDAQRALIRLLVLVALAGLAACAGRQTELVMADPNGLPASAQVDGVPFYPQGDKACGPASLAMALGWAGERTVPDALSAEVYTPGREGSLAPDMLAAARRHGRLAVPVNDLRALLAELAAGHPVVVFQNLGLDLKPIWHFAVATGYDLAGRRIVLNSGLDERLALGLDTFEHTWDRTGRWGMVVLPPGELPVSASADAVAAAAAGIERAGRPKEAAAAYQAILVRWPESLPAAIGLGNARFALNDLKGAEAAFRSAVSRHPDAAPAWNNLAHVLLSQNRRSEARAAAEKAVAIAGREGIYAETWEAVMRR